MKTNYYPDTDSLYIELSAKESVESREVSEGVAPDYDKDGNLVGIDIDNVNKKIDADQVIRKVKELHKYLNLGTNSEDFSKAIDEGRS